MNYSSQILVVIKIKHVLHFYNNLDLVMGFEKVVTVLSCVYFKSFLGLGIFSILDALQTLFFLKLFQTVFYLFLQLGRNTRHAHLLWMAVYLIVIKIRSSMLFKEEVRKIKYFV